MTARTIQDHFPTLGLLSRPSKKENVELAALGTFDAVILMFGGPWCRCGKPDKEELKEIYHDLNRNGQCVEFIFAQWRGVRPDIQSIPEAVWEEYMSDMPWLVLDAEQSSAMSQFKSSWAPTFMAFCLREGEVQEMRMVCMLLRDHGADAFPFTEARETELQGFFDACLCGDVEAVKHSLKADPGFSTRQAPQEWHNYHIMRGGWQPVDGSNMGVKNASGQQYLIANSPAYGLHLAAGNGHTDIIEVLLKANANLEAQDGDGDTALAWATWCGRREAMDQLLAAGADSSFADSLSREHFEAIQGDVESLQYLKGTR